MAVLPFYKDNDGENNKVSKLSLLIFSNLKKKCIKFFLRRAKL